MKLIIILTLLTSIQSFEQTTNNYQATAKKMTNPHFGPTNYYNNPAKNKDILNTKKYIDTSRQIMFQLGTNSIEFSKITYGKWVYLITGTENKNYGGLFIGRGNDEILAIKIDKGKLFIKASIYSFDGKIVATIENNVLETSNIRAYKVFATDSSFEVIDEYFIPILQIQLIKKGNIVKVSGAFNMVDCWVILSNKKDVVHLLPKPKLNFQLQQRDSLLQLYLIDAKKWLNPIHNQSE